jgi:hypothetical protein
VITSLGEANVDTSSNQPYVEAMKVVAFALSPDRCGIYDELLALIRTNVLTLDDHRGIPMLAKNWWSNVDVLLLDDMWHSWGTRIDVKGNYGITANIRKLLHRKWIRSDSVGWSLVSQPDDIIFEFEEFDDWRVAFESRLDGVDGIGRFG